MGPVAEAPVARATEPDEEQPSEYEGANDPAGPGGEDALDVGSTDGPETPLQDEDSTLPGGAVEPGESESLDGPAESESPLVEAEAAPKPTRPAPPATAPAPAPTRPGSGDAQSPAAPPPPPSRPAPVRRRAETKRVRPKPTRTRADRGRAKRLAPGKRIATGVARPTPTAETAGRARPTAPVAAAAEQAVRGATHVVRPGESLWSIASARLGDGATPAQIAREVQRLWALNAAAIGTGDPDLIGVGVELRLR